MTRLLIQVVIGGVVIFGAAAIFTSVGAYLEGLPWSQSAAVLFVGILLFGGGCSIAHRLS